MNEILQAECKKLKSLRDKKQAKKQESADAEKAYDAQVHVVSDLMASEEVKSVKFDGLGNFINAPKECARVSDKSVFWEWIEGEPLEDLVEKRLGYHTLNRENKAYFEEHGTHLPGCEAYIKPQVTIKK